MKFKNKNNKINESSQKPLQQEKGQSKDKMNDEKKQETVQYPQSMSKKNILKGTKGGSKGKRWTFPESNLFLKAVKNQPEGIQYFDISHNGKVLAVATNKKMIYIFNLGKILSASQVGETHEFLSFQVESNPNKIAISEKANYVAVSFATRTIIYERKGKTYAHKSEITGEHSQDIMDLYISEEKPHLLTIGAEKDKILVAWDLKGNKLAKLNTQQTDHRNCCIDKSNYRVTIGTWSSDASIYGSLFDRENKFTGLKKVMSATGHKSGILSSSFDLCGTRLVSISKDETIKDWSLNVKWESGEAPKLINTFKHEFAKSKPSSLDLGLNVRLLERESRKFLLIFGYDIDIYELTDGELTKFEKVDNAHSGEFIQKGVIVQSTKDDSCYMITHSKSKILAWDLANLKL